MLMKWLVVALLLLHLLFIEFEKAFASNNRECFWNALCREGILKELTAIIIATYDAAKCQSGKILDLIYNDEVDEQHHNCFVVNKIK